MCYGFIPMWNGGSPIYSLHPFSASSPTPFRINIYRTPQICCICTTYEQPRSFRINTYKKHGGRRVIKTSLHFTADTSASRRDHAFRHSIPLPKLRQSAHPPRSSSFVSHACERRETFVYWRPGHFVGPAGGVARCTSSLGLVSLSLQFLSWICVNAGLLIASTCRKQ
jgi:hypothetical protein